MPGSIIALLWLRRMTPHRDGLEHITNFGRSITFGSRAGEGAGSSLTRSELACQELSSIFIHSYRELGLAMAVCCFYYDFCKYDLNFYLTLKPHPDCVFQQDWWSCVFWQKAKPRPVLVDYWWTLVCDSVDCLRLFWDIRRAHWKHTVHDGSLNRHPQTDGKWAKAGIC